jgi:hypothetical protein
MTDETCSFNASEESVMVMCRVWMVAALTSTSGRSVDWRRRGRRRGSSGVITEAGTL